MLAIPFDIYLIFVLGLVIGSFLNVVILRSHAGESFIKGRSHCPHCRHELSWPELVPVVSFLRQYGKCLSCGMRISWQYPAVELAAGISFVFAYNIWAQNLYSLLSFWLAISAGIVILVSDIRSKIIPNGAVLTLLLASFLRILAGFNGWTLIFYDILSAFLIALFFFALWFFSRGTWMGFGDAKLILATSLFTGFPASIAAFLFAFWSGGIFGIILLISHRGGLKSQIPFGPFILLGMAIAFIFAEHINNFVRYF